MASAAPTPRARPRSAPRAARPASVKDPRRWWVRYAIAFVFAVLVVNAVAGERGYLEMRRSEQRLAEAQRVLAAVRAENASLQSDVQRIRTDPEAVEEAVRDELGFAKPDELVFTVKEPRPHQAPPATSTVPAPATKPTEQTAPSAR